MTAATLPVPARPRRTVGVGIAEIIERRLIRTAFQPIVDLRSEEVVGYEALSRGPEGTRLEHPTALFRAARLAGLSAELDWVCRASALRAAIAAGVHRTRAVYINVEAPTLTARPPRWVDELTKAAREAEITVVLEITERAISSAPASLLAATARLRRNGTRLALDDVGTDARSLALLPFLRPEVTKLDIAITQASDFAHTARTATAVHAHAERSGARIVAEGIETEDQLDTALALGADLGQGWLFGRPGPLTAEAALPTPAELRADLPIDTRTAATPFDLLSAQLPVRRGTKRLLARMSRGIEAQVETDGDAVVLLACFQDAAFFTQRTRARYRRLAERAALVGALGAGLDLDPEPGVRGAPLWRSEPLRGEWTVCAVGPYLAGAFSARDLGDTGPDPDRRFDFVMTRDREQVVAAARALMVRLSVD